MTKTKSNLDRFVTFAAFLMSFSTLLIFFYQTHLMREESRLSVRPLISFTTKEIQEDTSTHFEFRMTNKGLGPAILNSMTIIYQGKRNSLGFSRFLKQQLPKLPEYGELQAVTTIARGNTLSPNEHVVLFHINIPKTKLEAFLKYVEYDGTSAIPFEFEIAYSSIYEEHWRINSTSDSEYPELLSD